MNDNSRIILRRVTLNHPCWADLTLVGSNNYGVAYGDFYSDNSDDYSTLGAAIANNTHLFSLTINLSNRIPLGVTNRGFFNGLTRNSSIRNLELYCNRRNIAEGVGQEILKVYQENNNQLTVLGIYDADLQNGPGDRVIVDTLRSCKNLQRITLKACNITDEQLLPIVDAMRGHQQLDELTFYDNNIGNGGCDAIATLLIDPNCNLHTLDLWGVNITDEGAIIIANSLVNNTQLQELDLRSNAIGAIDQSVEDAFSRVLCNTSSINSTFLSNHTLEKLFLVDIPDENGQRLASLLIMNEETNKRHVAIKKILKHHPNIDMDPMFEWDAEGEQSLKALPYVLDWFDRAKGVFVNDDDSSDSDDNSSDSGNNEVGGYYITKQKLSALFAFALAMPLLFEGVASIKTDGRKRKR